LDRITIDPITRLEGHGRIDIFLDRNGDVENAYFRVPELRGFERFCVGRIAEDMPVITSRICGICPEAHQLASVKALEELFGVTPTETAKKIRELLYMAFFVNDHATHFYAMGGPDFIVGPEAPPEKRNLLGVIEKLGGATGKEIIECRSRNNRVLTILNGRGMHGVCAVPGGWSRAITREDQKEIVKAAKDNVDFARFSLKFFEDVILKSEFFGMMTSDLYLHKTYYMGTVDARNALNLYDGDIRVISPDGKELVRYRPAEYLSHIAEHVEPWTYLKFPYLKNVGWKGFEDGPDSGVYCASPLARLNVSEGMTTPEAQIHFERFFNSLGTKKGDGFQPVHFRLATHWARLIELLHAAERMLELASDPLITSGDIRNIPTGVMNEKGVGSLEAPRGTLTHHYFADEKGVLTKVNIIAGTTNNYAPISLSVKRAAKEMISGGKIIREGILNRIEMAFRLYDPCLSCATHAGGRPPLPVCIRNRQGEVVEILR